MTFRPPIAPRHVTSTTIHGDTRTDEYSWLRDREDPETLAYLNAENDYTEAVLAHLAPARARLFEEIRSRVVETDMSVPVRKGPYWYYSRTVEGLSYPIFCRRPFADEPLPPIVLEAVEDEEVLFDENLAAQGHEFYSAGIISISPDHRILAVASDTIGDERHQLRFHRIDGAPDPSELIDDVSYGFAWANDSATILYTRVDESWRPFQLWRHRIGSDPSDDKLVLQEDDARFNLSVGRSRDERVILVSASSSTTTEISYLSADRPFEALTLLCGRVDGVELALEHLTLEDGAQCWLKLTNEDEALDFRLDVSPHDDVAPNWSTVIPHRPGLRLEGVDGFASHLVLSERAQAETQLRIVAVSSAEQLRAGGLVERGWTVTAPEHPQSTWLGENPEHVVSSLRIGQSSLVTPHTVAQVSLETRALEILKRQEVPGGYQPERYVSYRAWATTSDGTALPLSIVHLASLLDEGAQAGDPPARPAPCLLYGYGSYEISIDPSFSVTRLSLLDRGVIFAIAHVRGGGELGRRWYEEGRLASKANSFDDFIAAAEHLVEKGIADPRRLAARGGSAGGLLMGAVANRGPERFCALLAEVPFVDALNSMLDASLPLTVGEYEEWGNPSEDPAAYETIKGYAPYENIIKRCPDGSVFRYPPMLVTAGLNDTRVGYWEPAKYVARLRAANPQNPILLRIEMGAGHGGPSGRYDSWREEAFALSWLLEQLGVLEEA
jgi:oligopeptidase B